MLTCLTVVLCVIHSSFLLDPLIIMNLALSSDPIHLLSNSSPSMRSQLGNTTIAESPISGIVLISVEKCYEDLIKFCAHFNSAKAFSKTMCRGEPEAFTEGVPHIQQI